MHLIPTSSPDETVTIGRAPGGQIELRIGRTASRVAVLSAAEARRGAEALVAAAAEGKS